MRFTKHTNAWVPFVIGALNRLRPGGRLAMVVPAELLHVLHAESIRRYLLRECSNVLVLDPEELWFEGAHERRYNATFLLQPLERRGEER